MNTPQKGCNALQRLRASPDKRCINYLGRAFIALLVAVTLVSCGEESATEESTTEETTAATATTNSLTYVALGDSLATGYGIADSYVYRYATLLSTDTETKVNVYNLGVDGLTSERLRTEIENNQRVKDALEQADVVTINIGANDLLWARWQYQTGNCGGADNQDCLKQAVEDFRPNWDTILAEVTAARAPGTAIVRTTDFYNPFVDVDRATYSWPDTSSSDFLIFKKYLEQINVHIAKSSDAYDIPHAEVYRAFNGSSGDEDPSSKGYISSDGVHPSDEGHAVIAQELRKLAYAPLFDYSAFK